MRKIDPEAVWRDVSRSGPDTLSHQTGFEKRSQTNRRKQAVTTPQMTTS